MTYRMLLAVDGSDPSLRATQHVANLAAMMPSLEIFVVNVQPLGDDWRIRRMIKPEEIEKMEKEWSEESMASSIKILQKASVVSYSRMAQGDVAPTIIKLAQELLCQHIVMGTRGHTTTLGDLLLGSVAHKVLHLSPIPVTLVK